MTYEDEIMRDQPVFYASMRGAPIKQLFIIEGRAARGEQTPEDVIWLLRLCNQMYTWLPPDKQAYVKGDMTTFPTPSQDQYSLDDPPPWINRHRHGPGLADEGREREEDQ